MADDPTPRRGLLPSTLRLIILCLTLVVVVVIASVTTLAIYGVDLPDGLVTIAATAVGALGVMAASAMKGD